MDISIRVEKEQEILESGENKWSEYSKEKNPKVSYIHQLHKYKHPLRAKITIQSCSDILRSILYLQAL